ncbi:MerR family transcriptional regulator [Actinophytocola oryzae]|uniref:MerR family redox-sensitive transcriptional activator SoxR n=1 Tax=Actinophytocola oryzae TaxID=502181 RepID=A0A4R7VNS2_9PSEU|nr:MerR family transcriptional regulator [Actinophytocola oryzae]TDV50929.1 MerR family redox-sensitive transcriptional activator SoxR [Actinophytocola oryzae]
MLTIGELADATGVATSALRYWEDQGLLAPTRANGHRRYADDAVTRVGQILLLQDAGYTLREIRSFGAGWRELAARKLAELDGQIAKAQAARSAVAHSLACPHEDVRDCPKFVDLVTARLAGELLHVTHPK